jgi:acyl-CoA oxidase
MINATVAAATTPPSDEYDPRYPPTNHPPTTINGDLANERSSLSFTPLHITNFIDGNSHLYTSRRRQLEAWIITDPSGIFSNETNNYIHRTERHVRSLAKFVRLIELCRMAGIGEGNSNSSSRSSSSSKDEKKVKGSPIELDGDIITTSEFQTLVSTCSDDPFPTSLHWVMFVPNIRTLCDDEQQRLWLPLCRDWKMIGCYAQTELGHGSNIRALETTATFVKEANGSGGDVGDGEWIINSPTVTSTKFWPGTLGKTANHAMIIAQLIDGDGIERGIHNFIVPLRSMDDHTLLPGVMTGDIGPKIGYNNMDNGYAIFTNVRIPRRNMAMRFAYVDENGKYTKKKAAGSGGGGSDDAASKVAYITMMQVRAYIIHTSNEALAMACTIAIRYSIVRRQGYNGDDDDTGTEKKKERNAPNEFQVLDYRQQQSRLLPLLAASYATYFTGKHVLSRLKDIEQRLVSGDVTITKIVVADVHATTSALKSFCTTYTADGIEDCRKACGGHGFLVCSGLVELSNTYLQSCTVEGDNYMLPQQVVKVLLKLVNVIQKSSSSSNSSGEDVNLKEYVGTDMEYLIGPLKALMNKVSTGTSTPLITKSTFVYPLDATSTNFGNISTLLLAFQHRSACLLLDVSTQLHTSMVNNGLTAQQAWNDALLGMARASRAHASYLLLRDFHDGLVTEELSSSSSCLGTNEITVLRQCLVLLGLYWMDKYLDDFLYIGALESYHVPHVRHAYLDALSLVRPAAIGLVDARDFHDFKLKSALGRYDGDVYPAIMDAARRDPLNVLSNNNSTNGGGGGVGLGYEEHLKRLIVGGVGEYHPGETKIDTKNGLSGTVSRL